MLVLGEHAAARVGRCTGRQRGCGVLHVPLMSFLGQARPWGELISKQATERSPYSPLPPPLLPLLLPLLLLALQLIILFFCSFSPLFSLPLCFRCCELSLPSTLQFSLCFFFFSLSLSVFPLSCRQQDFDFSHRHKQFGQQVKSQTDRLAIAAA